MKKYIIPIIVFIALISYIGYREWCYRQDTYVKLDVIASTSDMVIYTDKDKNILVDTGHGILPYMKNGKPVNIKDYKKEQKDEKETK